MTSSYERPDLLYLTELEQLASLLENEVAGWRRRCLKAETELYEFRARGGVSGPPELAQARHRIGELETENQALQLRIGAAREQLEQLRLRLRFIEEQTAGEPT